MLGAEVHGVQPARGGTADNGDGARSAVRAYHSYSYAEDRAIDLTAFQSRQLWPLLDEGEAAGLQLVYGHRLGTVARYRAAEVCLDATGDPAGALVLAPAVRIDGEDGVAAPVMFIGSQGHGVVYLPPGAPALLDAIVADELNVDEVVVTDELSKVLRFELLPNFRLLGPRFGSAVGEVRAATLMPTAGSGAPRIPVTPAPSALSDLVTR